METQQKNEKSPVTVQASPQTKKWHEHKGLLAIVILAAIATLVIWAATSRKPKSESSKVNSDRNTQTPPLSLKGNFKVWEDGTAYVKGEVVDHKSGCERDGTCELIVQTPNEKVSLIYAEGDTECPNVQAAAWVQWGKNVTKGTVVKAFGAYKKSGSEHQITFCASKDYFILGENDPVPVGAYTEKFFDEVQNRRETGSLTVPDRVNLYLRMEYKKPILELSAFAGSGCSQAQDLVTENGVMEEQMQVKILGYPPYENGQDSTSPTCAMVAESRKQIELDTKFITAKGKQILFTLNGKENTYNLKLENNTLLLSPIKISNVISVKMGENPSEKGVELRLNLSASTPTPALLVEYESYGGLCPYGGCTHRVTFYNDGDIVNETHVYNQTTETYEAKTIEKQITTQELNGLINKINGTNFEQVKQKKFTGTCPTAYDGQAQIYTIYSAQQTEKLDSCEYVVDAPVFETISQLVAKYTL